LHSSIANDYIDASRMLIDHGSEVDVAESEGNTPLHKATMKNFIECIELLRSFGASPWIRNKAVRNRRCAGVYRLMMHARAQGKTCVDIARDGNQQEALQALMSSPLPRSYWNPNTPGDAPPSTPKAAASAITQAQKAASRGSLTTVPLPATPATPSTPSNSTPAAMAPTLPTPGASAVSSTVASLQANAEKAAALARPVSSTLQTTAAGTAASPTASATSSLASTVAAATAVASKAKPASPVAAVGNNSPQSSPMPSRPGSKQAAPGVARAQSSGTSATATAAATGDSAALDILAIAGVRQVTVYAFVAARPDELSFGANEPLTQFKRYDDGWCLGEHNGLVGMYPAKYARLELRPQHIVVDTASRVSGTAAASATPATNATTAQTPSSASSSVTASAATSTGAFALSNEHVRAAHAVLSPSEVRVFGNRMREVRSRFHS
jgi:hypothetical protein